MYIHEQSTGSSVQRRSMFPADKGLILKLPHLVVGSGGEFNSSFGNDCQSLLYVLHKNLYCKNPSVFLIFDKNFCKPSQICAPDMN